jgi:hypothetical protein
MTRALVIVAVLGACKTAGTIDLTFDLNTCDGSSAGAGAYVVVYAQQGTPCVDCTCGGCFDRDSTPALACDSGCSPDTLSAGVPLDLSPGGWAVVVDVHTADGLLFASQCVDVTVDRDGTADEASQATCAESCVTASSSSPP